MTAGRSLGEVLDQLEARHQRSHVFVEGIDPVSSFRDDGQLAVSRQADGTWAARATERGNVLVDERFASEEDLCAFILDRERPPQAAPERSFEERYESALRQRRRLEAYNAQLVAKGLPPAKLPPLPARPR